MEFQRRMLAIRLFGILGVSLGLTVSGCASASREPKPQTASLQVPQTSQEQAATIVALNEEIARLNRELDQVFSSRDDLARAKSDLENQLQGQVASGDASVSMEARGLVVTVLDRILFDSGKAELKPESQQTLQTVASILSDRVRENMVYVEGHTDNVPIRFSNWRSNWELSTARSTEVVHMFVEQLAIDPRRIAAVGYGEFHPISDNNTYDGRLKNRRVEIVISPNKVAS